MRIDFELYDAFPIIRDPSRSREYVRARAIIRNALSQLRGREIALVRLRLTEISIYNGHLSAARFDLLPGADFRRFNWRSVLPAAASNADELRSLL